MGNCQTISEKDIKDAMTNFPPNQSIRTSTWTKDSYGLYDYGSKDSLVANSYYIIQ